MSIALTSFATHEMVIGLSVFGLKFVKNKWLTAIRVLGGNGRTILLEQVDKEYPRSQSATTFNGIDGPTPVPEIRCATRDK